MESFPETQFQEALVATLLCKAENRFYSRLPINHLFLLNTKAETELLLRGKSTPWRNGNVNISFQA